jgi:nucleotide-binding universal stress UspA family protein
MFKNVVVGVGGNESWQDAVALGGKLLSADGRLTLANVFVFGTEPHLSSGYNRDVEAIERARAAELLQRARARAGMPAGARWRGAASVGRGLHELAQTLEADALVVGASRQGMVGRALLRDNTLAALNGAPCAVAVAPTGYAQRAREIRRVRMLDERLTEDFAGNSYKADLLVVGSRGHGPLGRLLDRRTLRNLARDAPCPSLVLPRGHIPSPRRKHSFTVGM